MKHMMLFVVLTAFLFGCQEKLQGDGGNLEQYTWALTSYKVDGKNNRVENKLTAQFKSGKIKGFSGCNDYFGTYTTKGNELNIQELGGTEKYCKDVMEVENVFLDLLETAKSYAVKGNELTIVANKGELVFSVLKEAPKGEDKPKTDESSPWKVDVEDNTMSGEFAYMADAAVFIDCKTGERFGVVMEGAFKEMENTYQKTMGDDAGKRAYTVLEGRITKSQQRLRTIYPSKLVSMTKEASCKTDVQRMGGEFVYFADAAIFMDCATQTSYNVAATGARMTLEKEYLKVKESDGERVYVELEGFLIPAKSKSSRGPQGTLHATKVFGFLKGEKCGK